jgi:hypothetical protein
MILLEFAEEIGLREASHIESPISMLQLTFRTAQFALLMIAASFVAAAPASAAERMPSARTQALIKAAAEQFQLSYRMRPAEGELRQQHLKAVVAAWRAAPHSRANDDRLTNWLRDAIRTSMPGSRDALPPMPNFAGSEPTAPQTPHVTDPPQVAPPEPTPTVAPTAPSPEKQDSADPFRDDPIEMQETK